jgi:hypothetical protein
MRVGANFVKKKDLQKQRPDVLQAWEEIATFTGRSVRTVRRWEELYDFPVHHDSLGIRAYPAEIDAWLAQPLSFRRPADFQANRRWNEDLRKDSDELLEQSRLLRRRAQSERAAMRRWHKGT